MQTIRIGAKGALLDLYEKAIADLKIMISDISDRDLAEIRDPLTADENCRSVQTVMTHVIHSGYGYATYILNSKGNQHERMKKAVRNTAKEYSDDLDRMFAFTETVFASLEDVDLETNDDSLKMKTNWGQLYDIEQLTEHAIVHILRHTRQINKMKNSAPTNI